jgi:fumarate hydratase class I
LGGDVVNIDLKRPMSEIRAELSKYPIKTRLSLTGPLIVARDIAHAKLKERIDRGEGLPPCITRAPRRRPQASRPARLARPQPVAWTRTSTSSKPRAAAS